MHLAFFTSRRRARKDCSCRGAEALLESITVHVKPSPSNPGWTGDRVEANKAHGSQARIVGRIEPLSSTRVAVESAYHYGGVRQRASRKLMLCHTVGRLTNQHYYVAYRVSARKLQLNPLRSIATGVESSTCCPTDKGITLGSRSASTTVETRRRYLSDS